MFLYFSEAETEAEWLNNTAVATQTVSSGAGILVQDIWFHPKPEVLPLSLIKEGDQQCYNDKGLKITIRTATDSASTKFMQVQKNNLHIVQITKSIY